VHQAKNFSVVADLEASFERIREEVDRIDVSEFHTEAEKIDRQGSWKIFVLYENGRKNAHNCQQCPTIVKILEKHSCVRRAGGLIYLSRLAPHSRVAAHRGPTNLRVRCHLPLRVPHGDCGMRVGNEKLRWTEGQCLVFDDQFEHEVWNNTDDSRIVLLIDMWHPELLQEEQNALNALQWYASRHAMGLHRYWKLNEEQGVKDATEAGRNIAAKFGDPLEEFFPIEDH
jgi:aspartate beta-hydroxylase